MIVSDYYFSYYWKKNVWKQREKIKNKWKHLIWFSKSRKWSVVRTQNVIQNCLSLLYKNAFDFNVKTFDFSWMKRIGGKLRGICWLNINIPCCSGTEEENKENSFVVTFDCCWKVFNLWPFLQLTLKLTKVLEFTSQTGVYSKVSIWLRHRLHYRKSLSSSE